MGYANVGGASPELRGMAHHHQIDQTYYTATAPDGKALAVVRFTDDRCAVICDGKPLDDHTWPLERMSECTMEFLRLAGLLRRDS